MFTTISIVVVLILVVSGIYFFPVSRVPYNKLYASVPEEIRRSLQTFRIQYPLRQVLVYGIDWHYIGVGEGEETILLLHGMGGGYDIKVTITVQVCGEYGWRKTVRHGNYRVRRNHRGGKTVPPFEILANKCLPCRSSVVPRHHLISTKTLSKPNCIRRRD